MTANEAVHFFMSYGGVSGPETSLLFEKPTAAQLRGAADAAVRRGQPAEVAAEAARVVTEQIGIRAEYQRIGLAHKIAAGRRVGRMVERTRQ